MNENDLKKRTKEFALRILKLVDALPNTVAGKVIANQIAKSGTSVAANYRAVCRGRSKADFISKLGIVVEECDESEFWLEMIIATEMLKPSLVEPLHQEAGELLAIFVSSRKSASESLSKNNQKSKIKNPNEQFLRTSMAL
ncbi:MAG: four helix bundle protein [Pyrinomonadaceae bacterium]|nr:four helix bundle protein [Pyrinomonadaceae bacterium]